MGAATDPDPNGCIDLQVGPLGADATTLLLRWTGDQEADDTDHDL